MRKKIAILLIVQLFLSFIFLYVFHNVTGFTHVPETNSKIRFDTLIPHAPIYIANDDDFQGYNFTGTGNSTDPYRIENLFINTTGIAIEIKQTTVHFVIQNCGIISSDRCIFINSVEPGTVSILYNTLESLDNAGIAIWNGCHESLIIGNIVVAKWDALNLFNCDYSQIKNNQFCNSSTGIYIEESSYCVIKENTCFNNKYTGIFFAFSTNVYVENNIVINNGYEGIATDTGDFSKIANNYCAYNLFGVFAIVTSDLYVFNNTCEYNIEGLRFEGGGNADIYYNIFYRNIKCGICLSWSDTSSIRYNTVEENGYYGAVLNGSSESNTIHHNTFLYNLGGFSQAFDDHENAFNFWYDININEGNFWSDIAGSFYNIDGPAGAIDPYPLNAIPGTPPPIQTTLPITTEPIEPTEPNTFTIDFSWAYLATLIIPVLVVLIKKRNKRI